jgi:ABC-2 type transport system permease protein
VLLAAKTAAVLAIEVLQAALLVGVAYALAWSPHGSATTVLSLVGLALLATAAFSGLGLLMAGTLRAETTLALANLVYVLLLVTGGVVFPLTKFPRGVEAVLQYSPTAAFADGLRAVLEHGASVPAHDVVTLAVWALVALGAAARTFRWE